MGLCELLPLRAFRELICGMIHVPCGLEAVVMQVGKFHTCGLRAMQPWPCMSLIHVFCSPGRGGFSSPQVGWGLLLHPPTTHRFTITGPEVMPLLPTPSCSHVAH